MQADIKAGKKNENFLSLRYSFYYIEHAVGGYFPARGNGKGGSGKKIYRCDNEQKGEKAG